MNEALMLAAAAGLMAGLAAGWRLGRRREEPAPRPPARDVAAEVENLKASNALLRTLAGSPDITANLFQIARRIRAIVPCDRIGLALLTEDREGYSTYTARLDASDPAHETRSGLHFPRRSSLIDEVVTAREGRIVEDIGSVAAGYLDANVVKSAGFQSFVLVPLVYEGEAFGTLNLVSRRAHAFSAADLHALKPVAEALASAYGTRRLANAYARAQLANELAELTFAFANDMSGAVQAIIGRCELLAAEWREPSMERELAAMLQQARRLREILNNMQRMTREHVSTTTRPQ